MRFSLLTQSLYHYINSEHLIEWRRREAVPRGLVHRYKCTMCAVLVACSAAGKMLLALDQTLQPHVSVTDIPLISDLCGNQSCRHLANHNPNPSPVVIGENETLPKPGGTGLIYQSERYPFGASWQTQLVFLDFSQRDSSFSAIDFDGAQRLFQSHQFTESEKLQIQTRLENDFAEFNLSFTTVKPEAGEYSTIHFECHQTELPCVNLHTGTVLGRANEPDDGNWTRDDVAYADPNLWRVIIELDPSGELLSQLSGIEIQNDDTAAAVSEAIVNQSANIAAHQLGHNLGLRHQDAFGPPGTGILANEHNIAQQFYPPYTGLELAEETVKHLMASANMGLNLRHIANRDLFFSERSALKLFALDVGHYQTEREAIGELPDELSNIQTIHLRKVDVPTTIIDGENANQILDVAGNHCLGDNRW